MKLKYYLRGLGIGIIVTALLMGTTGESNAKSNENSDAIEMTTETADVEASKEDAKSEEITSEAASESVIEDEADVDTLAVSAETAANLEQTEALDTEISDTEVFDDEQASSTEASTEDIEDETEEVESSPSVEDLLAMTQSAQSMESTSDVEEATETYTLTIASGDDSGTVSRKLANAGIIEDASEFDSYLMQHGYDKKISVGTCTIPAGATWKEIAEKLSGN